MKKLVFLFFCLFILINSCNFNSSESSNTSQSESQDTKLILGEFKLKELETTNNKKWLDYGYQNYSPNTEIVDKIKSEVKRNKFHISVYMGTWCEDSQREFPKFVKLLNQIDFDYQNLTLVGVDEDKVIPYVSEAIRKKINVFNVPTIIVYNENGEEMNRFVEFPQETLEEDLLKIFSGEDYKHVYDF